MKSGIYLLAIISMALASETLETEPIEVQQIVPSQQNFNQDLWRMSPSERERIGMNLNRDNQINSYESMPMPLNNNQWNDWAYMGYPNMMYNQYNPMMMYPGYNQNMNRMNSNCGCQQLCPPCYLPWLCIPCQCPCQTTPPPDSDTAPPPVDTTTTSTTTTTTTTTPTTTTTTQAISTCVPCTNPCNPCGPIWMPWIPCNNICVCNNGCQTVTPTPALITTTVAPVIKGNNCQCECAPCSPLGPCPPCPRNCPCK